MKLLIKKLLREAFIQSDCDKLNIQNFPNISQLVAEVNKFNTDEEFLRGGGLSVEALDRAAFGFSEEDIKTLMPKDLHIKWETDWENVLWEQKRSGLSEINYAKKISLKTPIDVIYENDKFYVDDGHHRFYAAKVLNKPLKVKLEIKQNATIKVSGNLGYDDFHRCLFNKLKK